MQYCVFNLKLSAYKDGEKTYAPLTSWNRVSHSAAEHGSSILKALIPGRKFPYPKSLYAVEDCLRFIIKHKPAAIILDFFAGSGTTTHAVLRLNRQDGGIRQCISVTNNEVAADEHKSLRERGLRPGDSDWERLGICDYVTKPRVQAAITGKTPEGDSIKGDYKFTDEFSMADGFEENAEFFTLTYETPVSVSQNRAFSRIAPLLWLRAGIRHTDLVVVENTFNRAKFDAKKIYFLNTQKLGKNSLLVRGHDPEEAEERAGGLLPETRPDLRSHTMWDTIRNTIDDPELTLYLVLDEAHRGMGKPSNAAQSAKSTIVKRLINGAVGVPGIPVVWGISATVDRFKKAMEGTQNRSILPDVVVDSAKVQESGLIKDTIILDTHQPS